MGTFYAATIFYNTLRQFGELDEEVQERLKYAKWKAADITLALKEGRTPLPGPAMQEEDLALLEESGFATQGDVSMTDALSTPSNQDSYGSAPSYDAPTRAPTQSFDFS